MASKETRETFKAVTGERSTSLAQAVLVALGTVFKAQRRLAELKERWLAENQIDARVGSRLDAVRDRLEVGDGSREGCAKTLVDGAKAGAELAEHLVAIGKDDLAAPIAEITHALHAVRLELLSHDSPGD